MIRLANTGGTIETFEASFIYTEPSAGVRGPFFVNHNKGKNPTFIRALINLPSEPGVWSLRPNWYIYNGLQGGTVFQQFNLNAVRVMCYPFYADNQQRNLKVTCYF